MTKKINVAILGATGSVGRELAECLSERNFPVGNIYALASEKSIGRAISFGNAAEIKIEAMNSFDFHKADIVFCCLNNDVAAPFIKKAQEAKAVVIDKSSLFRMHKDVPLIVPEVNANKLSDYKKLNIIANPNCNAIPISIALKVLHDHFGILRVVISTYQAVSGAGKDGMDELYQQTKAKFTFQELEPSIFEKNIAFNLIPKIGKCDINGYSDEEVKIMQEIQKIIGIAVPITVTCVRVPVFVGHCSSINVELEEEYNLEEIKAALSEESAIKLQDNFNEYDTPIDISGSNEVHISRLRKDTSNKNAVNFWLACDNLRKGAALNAVQIAEQLVSYM